MSDHLRVFDPTPGFWPQEWLFEPRDGSGAVVCYLHFNRPLHLQFDDPLISVPGVLKRLVEGAVVPATRFHHSANHCEQQKAAFAGGLVIL